LLKYQKGTTWLLHSYLFLFYMNSRWVEGDLVNIQTIINSCYTTDEYIHKPNERSVSQSILMGFEFFLSTFHMRLLSDILSMQYSIANCKLIILLCTQCTVAQWESMWLLIYHGVNQQVNLDRDEIAPRLLFITVVPSFHFSHKHNPP